MAMEVLGNLPERHAQISRFEALMHQRGCSGDATKSAVGGLLRRGWLSAVGSHLVVTKKGTKEGMSALVAR